MASRKRGRTAVGRTSRERPITKELVAVSKDNIAGSQVTTDLFTTTFPGTVAGLRWSLSAHQDGGTGAGILYWAIVIVPDGLSASTVAISDTSAFYEPEEHVLTFGVASFDNNVQSKEFMGATKTMRKLKGGDKLVLLAFGTATNTSALRGVVQFFVKS